MRVNVSAAVFVAANVLFMGMTACDADTLVLPTTSSPVMPVVPTPTYPLNVYVTKMGSPCSDCIVEIINGPGAGASAITERTRAVTFELPEPGVVTVRASRAGYHPATTTVTIDPARGYGSAELSLQPSVPLPDLAGARLVEVRADAACAHRLPAEFQTRSYPVSLVKDAFNVFTAKPVHEGFSRFVMGVGVLVDEAFFVIESWEDEGAGIIEQLPDGKTLQIHLSSDIVPVSTFAAISTPIAGTISYCDARARARSSDCIEVCESNAHQLTLTRR